MGQPGGAASPPVDGDSPAPGERRPLLCWVVPTRGYVAVAAISGAVLLVAGGSWQLWALLAPGGPRTRGGGGWSVASLAVLVLAIVVLVELSRRPQPRAAGPRDRSRQARAGTRGERRVVRRAMWRGVLPANRRLARAAAHRLEHHATNLLQVPLYLFLAAGALGRTAVIGGAAAAESGAALIGVFWTGGALLLLAMVAWLRHQARRLNTAWLAAEHEQHTGEPEMIRDAGAGHGAVMTGSAEAAYLLTDDEDDQVLPHASGS